MNQWTAAIDAKVYSRWLLAALTLSILAMVGMVVSVPDIDGHPITFALSMNWVVAGFVGAVTHNCLLRKNPWRFRFARWEREGRVYRFVGIEAFRWLLRKSPLRWLNPAVRTTARKSDLENLLRQMNFAEGAHLIGGAITLALAIGFAVTDHMRVGLSFAVVTLLCHFYPLITQRWNRGRVARVVQRMRRDLHGAEVPDDTLQRTRPSRSGCNPCDP